MAAAVLRGARGMSSRNSTQTRASSQHATRYAASTCAMHRTDAAPHGPLTG